MDTGTDVDVSGRMSSDDGAGKPSRKRVAFTPVARFSSIYTSTFLLCLFIRNAVFCDTEETGHDQLEDQRRVERCEYNIIHTLYVIYKLTNNYTHIIWCLIQVGAGQEEQDDRGHDHRVHVHQDKDQEASRGQQVVDECRRCQ